jgi:hypothetical protein
MQTYHVIKLVKKELGITSYEALYNAINSKPDDFYQTHFFTDKKTYVEKIIQLIDDVDEIGEGYVIALKESRSDSGSFMQGYASAYLGEIRKTYIEWRKRLINHLRFFIDPIKVKK